MIMLIDQILSNPIIFKSGMLSTDLRGRMSKAMKFAQREDFATAADEFSKDISNVNKVLALARLPYRECWFEVAQADRKFFSDAPLDPGDSRCSRIGFLCTQLNHQGALSAQLFWSFAAGENIAGVPLPPATSGFMLVVDPNRSDTGEVRQYRGGKPAVLISRIAVSPA